MKTELTKEQSQHLIDLGVPKEKASQDKISTIEMSAYSIFTLTDLLEILPKEIEVPEEISLDTQANLTINGFENEWDVSYEYLDNEATFSNYISFDDFELIDALYELLCWVIENKYLKFD